MRTSKRFGAAIFLSSLLIMVKATSAVASDSSKYGQNRSYPRSLIDIDVDSLDFEFGSSIKMTTLAHTSAALAGGRLGLIINDGMTIGAQSYSLANKIRPDVNKGRLDFRSVGVLAGARSVSSSETIKTRYFHFGTGIINAHENFTEQGRAYHGTGYYVEPELGAGIRLLAGWGLDFGAGYRFVSISGTPGYSGSDLTGLFFSCGTSVWF